MHLLLIRHGQTHLHKEDTMVDSYCYKWLG